MPRTRSVLVDNTIGRIFRNVTTVAQASAASVIAGDRLTTRSIGSGQAALIKIANNIGGKGLFFVTGASVTQLRVSLIRAPRGRDALIQVRKGLTYATSTTVGEPYAIPAGNVNVAATATYTVAITLAAGESLYFDVVQVGSMFAGTGLTVTVNLYTV